MQKLLHAIFLLILSLLYPLILTIDMNCILICPSNLAQEIEIHDLSEQRIAEVFSKSQNLFDYDVQHERRGRFV